MVRDIRIIMSLRFFTIPVLDDGRAAAELNGFLHHHKVLSVDRRWVEQGSNSFWHFCIDYLDGSSPLATPPRASQSRPRVDYKEILSPEEFAVFARLRDLRKEIAQTEAVPVYTIFTNEHLARMVQARAASKADLEKIAGVGDARIDKYGGQVLDVLSRAWGNANETNGQPVSADPGS
jgi:superfamily II DNA helicase RecQ